MKFIFRVDSDADGQWHDCQRFTVEPGKPFVHELPKGYAAHWLHVKAGADCIAAAQLRYE